jgi:hypothetical protein
MQGSLYRRFYQYVPKIGDPYFRLHFNFVGRIAVQWRITERACLTNVRNVFGSNLGIQAKTWPQSLLTKHCYIPA